MGSGSGQTRQAMDSAGEPLPMGLVRNLSELAREMQAVDTSQAVMERIVLAAVSEIDAACAAAITVVDRNGHIVAVVHTDERARLVSVAQQDTGQGPCLETSRDEVTLRSNDLRAESRWPQWSAAAVAAGVLSVLSFQLFVERDRMGALELYADQPDAFGGEDENTGLLLAAHAAIAMADRRQVEHLHRALLTRDMIGQAKGILMERYKLTSLQAFDLLIKSSQTTHQKLHEVAEAFVLSGALPNPPPHD